MNSNQAPNERWWWLNKARRDYFAEAIDETNFAAPCLRSLTHQMTQAREKRADKGPGVPDPIIIHGGDRLSQLSTKESDVCHEAGQ